MTNTRKSFWRFLFKFHRYTGLCAAIFIIMLSITGILLNHTEDLHLDSRYVTSKSILDWYGIKPANIRIAFQASGQWFIQADGQIYFNDRTLLPSSETLLGAVASESYYLLGLPNLLILITPEGEIIDRIKKPVSKIAASSSQAIFIQSEGRTLFSNDDLLSWHETDQQNIPWTKPSIPPEKLTRQVKKQSLYKVIPYERLMLDIHSGRFFGTYGVLIVDIAAILFILLAISGCWIWFRHTLRHLKHQK